LHDYICSRLPKLSSLKLAYNTVVTVRNEAAWLRSKDSIQVQDCTDICDLCVQQALTTVHKVDRSAGAAVLLHGVAAR
jgi:hypothetical protein